MATLHTQKTARFMLSPAVLLLLAWMLVPLAMTLYFSVLRYNLLTPGEEFTGLGNYEYFLTDPTFFEAIENTLLLVGVVLLITLIGGALIALVIDQPLWGQGIVRLMVIAPFFVMPTVSALVWKNMFMHPVSGLFAWIMKSVGLQPIDWFAQYPLTAVVIMVSWQWRPFATLILLTAIQSLDEEQKEAAEMDGTPPISYFFYIVLPHLARPITVVILIETIFLLNVFAEIFVTGTGGPAGNLPYLVYFQGLLNYDVGGASAGGIVAVVLANIVAFFLVRIVGRNLEGGTMARAVSMRRRTVTSALAWGVGFLIFFPILWTILTSFKTELEAFSIPPKFLFFDWTTENYAIVQERSNYLRFVSNWIILSLGSTLVALLFAVPAAWAMAFAPGKRTKDLLMWMLSTKMMPPVGALIPVYLIFRDMGLLDSRGGLIAALFLLNLPIIVWMLYTYFKEIPPEILEAARMDGASLWKEL